MPETAMSPINVLIVEDEPDQCEAMVSFLELEGFQATGVGTAAAAERWLNEQAVDIVILDVGLPDQDGIAWITQTRASRRWGLILATARGALPDRLRGLAAGADAYLVKPIELEELVLVVQNLARRIGHEESAASSGWTLDTVRWELVANNGRPVKLTRSETALLATLADSPGQPVARGELILALGHVPDSYDPRRMEILIRRLRNKVQEQSGLRLPLDTVHGFGYAFVAGVAVNADPD